MNANQVKAQIKQHTTEDFQIENLGDSRHFTLKSKVSGFDKARVFFAIKQAGFETLTRYSSATFSLIVDFKIY
jgi:hypothetical protein